MPVAVAQPPQQKLIRPRKATQLPSPSRGILLRGGSFVDSYNSNQSLDSSVASSVDDGNSTGLRMREPTMLRGGTKLIAPLTDESKKYTIVLDLDETVVYARDGPLYARAHLDLLLTAMDEYCEVIVWTAGVRRYAKAILREINGKGIIKHLIYRDKTWFNPADYTKDLKRLGRDMDYVLIIENTPDCVRVNPQNGIIVADFEGGSDEPESPKDASSSRNNNNSKPEDQDHTFVHLIRLIQDLGKSGEPVPKFLSKCPLLERQTVAGTNGDIPIFYLTSKKRVQRKGKHSAEAPKDEKQVKANRDKRPAPRLSMDDDEPAAKKARKATVL